MDETTDKHAEIPNPDSLTAKHIQSLGEKGWNQKRIAKKLSIPTARLSRWARGIGTQAGDDALRIRHLDAHVPSRKKAAQPDEQTEQTPA